MTNSGSNLFGFIYYWFCRCHSLCPSLSVTLCFSLSFILLLCVLCCFRWSLAEYQRKSEYTCSNREPHTGDKQGNTTKGMCFFECHNKRESIRARIPNCVTVELVERQRETLRDKKTHTPPSSLPPPPRFPSSLLSQLLHTSIPRDPHWP